MAKQVQLRRGSTAQHSTFTGANGEVTVNTDTHGLVVHDGTTAGGFPLPASVRELLTAPRTYYVATTGSDSNDGLSIDTPFLTIQKALNVCRGLDSGQGNVVTISVADGTYSEACVVANTHNLSVMIIGNETTPSNVILNTPAGYDGVLAQTGNLNVRGIKFVSSGNTKNALNARFAMVYIQNVEFGGGWVSHLIATENGRIEATGNYTISGGANTHWYAYRGGLIVVTGKTITLTGTPAFAAYFAYGQFNGHLTVNGNTFSGSATGTRYGMVMNSTCWVNGAGSTYLPGSVAGTTATGGQYA